MFHSWTSPAATVGLLLVQACIAPSGQAALPLRIAVGVHAISACGDSLAPAAVRDSAAARLTAAGITVSNIHTGRLDIDFDCVGVAPNVRSSAMVVHQCLSYSELVSAPSNANKSILAATWRQCESYTCSRSNCTASARYSGQLLDAFLSQLPEQTALDTAPHPAPPVPKPVQPPAKVLAPRHSATALIPPVPHRSGPAGSLVYAGIIMNCLCVLVYWQIRRRPGYSE